jgi:hypothetical protein
MVLEHQSGFGVTLDLRLPAGSADSARGREEPGDLASTELGDHSGQAAGVGAQKEIAAPRCDGQHERTRDERAVERVGAQLRRRSRRR